MEQKHKKMYDINKNGSNFVKSLNKKIESEHPHIIRPCDETRSKYNFKNRSDVESENSDVDAIDSDNKPDIIERECLNYIKKVHCSLINITRFEKELCQQFSDNIEATKLFSTVFGEISSLEKAYQIINENIVKMKSNNPNFHLYDVLLNPIISNLLKLYQPFLNGYSKNAKVIGNFQRENQDCNVALDRVRKFHGIHENINVDNCMYTVFNSLFSLELMFDRYRKCFSEFSPHYRKGLEAKIVISNLLRSINTGNNQIQFLEAQKELSLLNGKKEKARINVTFIHKGMVTKYARRDDKQLPRQLVLFSDCLFVTCVPNSISGTSRVRHELSIDSIQLSEIHDDTNVKDLSNMKWGLNITAKEAVQDFCFDSEAVLKLWKEKLLSVIKTESQPIKAPITNRMSTISDASTDNLLWIGSKAPRWQIDNATGICNGFTCHQRFSTTMRRHHCRADGLLYCDSCCGMKIKLQFERSDESRVCNLCYNIIFAHKNSPLLLAQSKKELSIVFEKMNHIGMKRGWLNVRKYNCAKNGFVSEDRYYCVIDLEDAFMSLYEKHEDKDRAEGIIFLGMVIRVGKNQSNFYRNLSSKQFTMEYLETNRNDVYLLTANSRDECQSWVACLKERIMSSINTK